LRADKRGFGKLKDEFLSAEASVRVQGVHIAAVEGVRIARNEEKY